jgi:hypothetical protein
MRKYEARILVEGMTFLKPEVNKCSFVMRANARTSRAERGRGERERGKERVGWWWKERKRVE